MQNPRMGLVTVTVRLQDTTTIHDPVVGAVVRFYDASDVFITEALTDALGKVDVLLDGSPSPAGTTYHVRAYRQGSSFYAPWKISVFDPPLPVPDNNDFLMDVNIFEVENSAYPGICRVSGYLCDQAGRPLPNRTIRLAPYNDVPVVYYAGLVSDTVETKSDDNGFVRFEVLCGGTYEIVIASRQEIRRRVRIPQRAGVLFADLVFPVPADVAFDPAGPYLIRVGESLLLTPHVLGSDYNDWGDGDVFVDYASDDSTVLTVARSGAYVSLTGNAVGTANLEVTRTDSAFKVVPDRVSSWTFPVVVAP